MAQKIFSFKYIAALLLTVGILILGGLNAEQKRRYIPEMAAGKAIWCQGFSEPSAGSDLASLRTRAERVGDEYVINGVKIWTSYAATAQFCFLLARTADGAQGRAGIAIFLVPMTTPGIDVRAIPSLIGHGDIHETFFTDVKVPKENMVGRLNGGWEIAKRLLQYERQNISGGFGGGGGAGGSSYPAQALAWGRRAPAGSYLRAWVWARCYWFALPLWGTKCPLFKPSKTRNGEIL